MFTAGIFIAGIFEVIFWIIGIFVVLGAIAGLLAFLGLRKLWRFVAGAFDDDGRPGPGNPPLSRRSAAPPTGRPVDDLTPTPRR